MDGKGPDLGLVLEMFCSDTLDVSIIFGCFFGL